MNLAKTRESVRLEISILCRKLMLSQSAVGLCEVDATPKQEEFLLQVLRAEVESRERSRRARLMSRAGFPVFKTFEGYERNGMKLPTSLEWTDITDCAFLKAKRNLVLYGPVGTGNYRKFLLMERLSK